MALNLRNALKKSQGGSIGVTIDGKKVWFDEDKFMKLLDNEDTKGKLLEIIAPGRKKLSPKADVSESRPVPKKPQETPSVYEEKDMFPGEKEGFYEEDDFVDTTEKKASPAPEQPAAEQTSVKQAAPTPKEKILSQAGQDPHTKEDEFEELTPENYPAIAERQRKMFNNHMKRYDILNKIDPKEAARREIEAGAEERFDEFAQRNGRRGMKYELLDDYKKDPANREFMFEYNRYETKNKEAIIDYNRGLYNKIREDKKEDLYQYDKYQREQREKVNQMIRERKKAAKTPEERVKILKALAKAEKDLSEAIEMDNATAIEAAEAEIELLNSKLGRKAEEKKGPATLGLNKETEVREMLKKEGYSPEEIEATIKEYLARKG